MAKSSKRTSTTRYSFSNEHISIALPSDWDRWDAPEGMLFSASAPDEDAEPFEAQVTVSKEELSEACDSTGYMMGNYIYLKTHFQNFVDHGTGSFDVAGGKVAWLNYSARFDEWNVTEKDFYIVVGQTAYLGAAQK